MNANVGGFSRRDAALLVLLAGLVALFFWRILTPNPADRAQFPPGDFTDQFYAFRRYEAHALAAGRLPLWSENYNSGHPFLADIQSAVFYPIGLANTLLNVALFGGNFSLFALELEALLHFFLAGAFTYLFARRVLNRSTAPARGLDSPGLAWIRLVSPGFAWFRFAKQRNNETTKRRNERIDETSVQVGAFTAALVFTFGGYLTSYPSLQLAILETATWLPLALYFLDRVNLTPNPAPRRSGEPISPFPEREEGRGVRSLILAGGVLGIAALAGHPQTFLFVLATCALYFAFRVWNIRAVVYFAAVVLIAFGIAAVQWVPAVEYQQLSTREPLSFADAAKGLPTLDVLQFILPGFASAFASPLYVGILPLWLAIYALLRRDREQAFWGGVALGALLLSFGFYVFAYVLFYLFVPGAALFRDQERLAFIVSFALALLAGYGIRELVNAEPGAAARRLFGLLPAGAAVALALLLTFFAAGVSPSAPNDAGRLAFLGDRAGLMLVIFGVVSLFVGLYLYQIITPRWFIPLAAALVLFDLWSVNETANKGKVEERFPDNPLIDTVKQDVGIFRVTADDQLLPGHFGIVYGLDELGGLSPLRLARYNSLLQLPRERVYALLNVKYAFTTQPQQFDGSILAQDANVRLVQLNASRAPAWVVGSTVVADDPAAFDLLGRADFDSTQRAAVASAPPFASDPRAAGGQVTITAHDPEHLALDANLPADGLILISENYYPGWQASVDGAPAEILRADLSLRAVPLRSGSHHIEMVYDPLSFKIGAAISMLALIACGILLLKTKD